MSSLPKPDLPLHFSKTIIMLTKKLLSKNGEEFFVSYYASKYSIAAHSMRTKSVLKKL